MLWGQKTLSGRGCQKDLALCEVVWGECREVGLCYELDAVKKQE